MSVAAAPVDTLLVKGAIVKTTYIVTLGEDTETYTLGPWKLDCDMMKSEVDEAIDARYLDPIEMSLDRVSQLVTLIRQLREMREREQSPAPMPQAQQASEADLALQRRIVQFLRRQAS